MNNAVTFALCLVQEETVKTGFCHVSVQAASLVVEEQEVVGGTETVMQTAAERTSFES